MSKLTQKELKEILRYNFDTGEFTWLARIARMIHVGDAAGYVTKCGYSKIKIKGKLYFAHRLAWFYVYGSFPKGHIDHINHNTLDNRIDNLRDVSRRENMSNTLRRKDNKSGFTGVTRNKKRNKWIVQIKVNGHAKYLGSFNYLHDAISVRKQANIKYGFHENHGTTK